MNNDHPLSKICPSSQTCAWKDRYRSRFNGYDLPIVECPTCGLQAQFPAPESIDELYDEAYYTGGAGYTYEDERATERFHAHVWDARLRTMGRYVKGGRFLDIGCSFGGFLARAKRRGFEPFGVEISAYSAKVARDRGFEVFQGEFLDSHWPDQHFSALTLIEVIEHLPNPNQVVAELARILRPGGLAVIQTANFDGWQARDAGADYHYYLPGHLFYYSADNLVAALRHHGFREFRVFYGVDFPLLAKLRKARGKYQKLNDYLGWWRIARYHWASQRLKQGRPVTSSMVVYAVR